MRRYAYKIGRRPVTTWREVDIGYVIMAGYDVIHASSYPPYGPHAQLHKARVGGTGTTIELQDVRIIPPDVLKQLEVIEAEVDKLRAERATLLEDKFLAFPLAKLEDFPAEIIRPGKTEAEAKAELPKGEEAKKEKAHGKELARHLQGLREGR